MGAGGFDTTSPVISCLLIAGGRNFLGGAPVRESIGSSFLRTSDSTIGYSETGADSICLGITLSRPRAFLIS